MKRVFRYEICKVIRIVPVLVMLLLLSMTINICYVFSPSADSIQNEFEYAQSVQKKYGIFMNDKFKKDFFDEMMTTDNSGFKDIFFVNIGRELDPSSSEEVLRQIDLFNAYINTNPSAQTDVNYESMNLLRSKINAYINEIERPEKIYIDYEAKHPEFQKQIGKLLDSDDTRYFFVSNPKTGFYQFIFKNLFSLFLIESLVISVIIIPYLINYEKERNTDNLFFTTKTGSSLYMIKLSTILLLSTAILLSIVTVTLTFYFGKYDFHGFWNAKINSCYFAENGIPLISQFSLTFKGLLFLYIILAVLVNLAIDLIFFIITKAVGNSFISTAICVLPVVCIAFINDRIRLPNFLANIANGTPFMMIINCGSWFRINYPGDYTAPFAGYELLSTVMWIVIGFALAMCQIYRLHGLKNV